MKWFKLKYDYYFSDDFESIISKDISDIDFISDLRNQETHHISECQEICSPKSKEFLK